MGSKEGVSFFFWSTEPQEMMQLNNPTPDIKDMIFVNSFQIIPVLVWLEDHLLGILVSNMFYIYPEPWGNDPIWRS